MKSAVHTTTLLGLVTEVDCVRKSFKIRSHSGDIIECFVSENKWTTNFHVLQNLDHLSNDRVLKTPDVCSDLTKYLRFDLMVAVEGILQTSDDLMRLDARKITLLDQTAKPGRYLFESSHWWLTQITQLGDKWLYGLFGDKREFTIDDFTKLYRTNLGINGFPAPHGPVIQEMAALSRLIYGLSSAYLLTGSDHYFEAAQKGVAFLRGAFRSPGGGGTHILWAYGKENGRLVLCSQNPDDQGTIPLYEQIYALAGLAQYYRITRDWEVLEVIRLTIEAFNKFYLDEIQGGFFSHLDAISMRTDDPSLDTLGESQNRSRKNWNSIGDHIPAYLVNLILALEPLPADRTPDLERVLETCKKILDDCTENIVTHLCVSDNPFVQERFYDDWKPDYDWGWQQDRGIVGHNLKIAWNLTRIAHYYASQGKQQKADELIEVARKRLENMEEHGIDLLRSGCFDCLERNPGNEMPLDFSFGSTKDFWQQEQMVLAYYIFYAWTKEDHYLEFARSSAAFWNLYFLDRDHNGIFFRTTESGIPIIEGGYGNKGGHAISGYHAFELNFLAHIYVRCALAALGTKEEITFCLYFRPNNIRSINVLPDFMSPGMLQIEEIRINGVPRLSFDRENFQIPLSEKESNSSIMVKFSVHDRKR